MEEAENLTSSTGGINYPTSPFQTTFMDYIDIENTLSPSFKILQRLLSSFSSFNSLNELPTSKIESNSLKFPTKIKDSKRIRFPLDLDSFRRFDSRLVQALFLTPSELIPQLEEKLTTSIMAHPILSRLYASSYHPTTKSPYNKEPLKFRISLNGSFGSNYLRPGTLSSSFFGRLVKIAGVVTKTTPIRPKVRRSVHFCPATGVFLSKNFKDAGDLGSLPTGSSYLVRDEDGNALETEFGLSIFEDSQLMQMQDAPEHGAERTGVLNVLLEGDLVDSCKPGDRVEIVGVYRAVGGKVGGLCRTVAKSFLVANCVIGNINRFSGECGDYMEERKGTIKGRDLEGEGIEGEREEVVKELSGFLKRANLGLGEMDARELYEEMGRSLSVEDVRCFNRILFFEEEKERKRERVKRGVKNKMNSSRRILDALSSSLMPHIHGLEPLKRSIVLQLLSGVEISSSTIHQRANGNENINRKERIHIRGDIHILLLGDPSTAKSQILRSVLSLAPLSISTSGRGSSGVGLTASVSSHSSAGASKSSSAAKAADFELDSGRTLEAGAMVRADRGIICIDEFDKMADGDRVALHEVMEQQTVTVAKAGIHCSLNARCSVLAAANPVFSFYDDSKTVQENVGLPDSLLSRFDLVFVLKDVRSTARDKRMAKHVIGNRREEARGDSGEGTGREAAMEPEQAIKYIEMCKLLSRPKLSRKAAELAAKIYAEIRNVENEEFSVPVTPRTLESILRLGMAASKSRLAEVAGERDLVEGIKLVEEALEIDLSSYLVAYLDEKELDLNLEKDFISDNLLEEEKEKGEKEKEKEVLSSKKRKDKKGKEKDLKFKRFLEVLDEVGGNEESLGIEEFKRVLKEKKVEIGEEDFGRFLERLKEEDKILVSNDIIYFL